MSKHVYVFVIGLSLGGAACAPVKHLETGSSFTPLPAGVWTSQQFPCPYEERGFLQVSAWIPQGGQVIPPERDPKVITVARSGVQIDGDLWALFPPSGEKVLSGALRSAGADALVYPEVRLAKATVSPEQCAELQDLGCATSTANSSSSATASTQSMLIVEGLAVHWLCPAGQPAPGGEVRAHELQAP